MTLRTFAQWEVDGRPARKARPIADLGSLLKRYGYTVYFIGNDEHMHHEPPEDHTPFSATGWPKESPYGVVFACDVMPPAAGSGLPTLAQLGARLVADRESSDPALRWIKYINWTDEIGKCWHDSWMPGRTRRPSSDRGHIHISARSDCADYALPPDYDPVELCRVGDTTMGTPAEVWTSAGADVIDNWRLSAADKAKPGANTTVRPAWVLAQIGAAVDRIEAAVTALAKRPGPTLTLSPADRDAIVAGVVDQFGPTLIAAAREGAAAAIAATAIRIEVKTL